VIRPHLSWGRKGKREDKERGGVKFWVKTQAKTRTWKKCKKSTLGPQRQGSCIWPSREGKKGGGGGPEGDIKT